MMFFRRRETVSCTINRRRTGSDQPLHAGSHTGFDDVISTIDHYFQALARLSCAGGDSNGGQVKDHINALKMWSDISEATDILTNQLNIAVLLSPLNVMKGAAAKVIKDDYSLDLLATDKQIGNMRADQAASAGYQYKFIM